MRALALLAVMGCGARTDLPCFDEPCPRPDEDELAHQSECEASLVDPPACTGTGLIATLEDDCIDDGGNGDTGDTLEIFCVSGIARFCLSHEACPWRSGVATPDQLTCSSSGLGSAYMASTIHECSGWQGHHLFCCTPDGRVGVR